MFKVGAFVVFVAVSLLAIAVGFVRSLPQPYEWDGHDD